MPQNVNFAIQGSYLLSFLESVPEVSAKLKEPRTAERKFEDVVKHAELLLYWCWFIDSSPRNTPKTRKTIAGCLSFVWFVSFVVNDGGSH